MPRSVVDLVEAELQRRIGSMSVPELASLLERLNKSSTQGGPPAPVPSAATGGRSRRGRRKRRPLSKRAKQVIRERMDGVKYGTPEYQKLRDKLVSELGVTGRQVSSFVRQKVKPATTTRRKKR